MNDHDLCVKLRLLALAFAACLAPSNPANALDFDNGNAAIEVVIPAAAPVIFMDVSSSGMDATLVLRVTTLVTNAWFDAAAPYNPPAVGVYTRLGSRTRTTNAEMNVALLFASREVLNSLLPQRAANWDRMLADAGLDPNDPDKTNLATPEGVGTVAGRGVVTGRLRDGMNQVGNEGGRKYNFRPYSDYTNYRPLNTAYKLFFPSRWQPNQVRIDLGNYRIQEFVTPQFALTEPYSYRDPRVFSVPPPSASNVLNFRAYKQQADEVLRASAELNDERKLKAELFDNKIEALGFSAVFAALSQGLDLFEFIQLDFLTNMAAFDAGIFTWQEKRRYDGVRPFSAIEFLYGDRPVSAWGGPGRGTVHDLPASEWTSYLAVADHPEYPSGSMCLCDAHAQGSRRYLPAGDALNWTVHRPAGSSRIEPGVTPAADTDLFFATWTQFASDCGQSRVWGGVHFQAAITEADQVCDVFGDLAYEYVASLVDGTAPRRSPSRRLRHALD